jgi:hypothetical protein
MLTLLLSPTLCLFTEGKIQEIQQNMDARLNNMPPSQRQQYYDLVAEQGALSQVRLGRWQAGCPSRTRANVQACLPAQGNEMP